MVQQRPGDHGKLPKDRGRTQEQGSRSTPRSATRRALAAWEEVYLPEHIRSIGGVDSRLDLAAKATAGPKSPEGVQEPGKEEPTLASLQEAITKQGRLMSTHKKLMDAQAKKLDELNSVKGSIDGINEKMAELPKRSKDQSNQKLEECRASSILY